MTRTEIARLRLRNERLAGAARAAPEEIVGWLGAVQAQDYAGAKWAVGQRAPDLTDADVERALAEGRVLRTHVLRPTWHLVAPADIRWLLALTAPRVKAAMATYDRKLGLDARTYARCTDVIARALAGRKHLTRAELGQSLGRARVAAVGQRLGHLLMRAELEAVVCSGPRRGKQLTYALLDERVPPSAPRGRDEALAELTRRYFRSHGPALPRDLAWWAGLKLADVQRGIEMARAHLAPETSGALTYWHAPPASSSAARPRTPGAHVVLLPNYDELIVAYRDHSVAVDPEEADRLGRYVFYASNVVVLNGRVVGGWRRTQARAAVVVETKLLVPLPAAARAALRAAAARYGRFLGSAVELRTGE